MLILKILLLQAYWFLPITFNSSALSYLFWPLSLILALLNYYSFKPSISLKSYLSFILMFSIWGWVQDGLLVFTGTVQFRGNIFWLNSIWVVFIAYFGDIFNKFSNLKIILLSLLGGTAGTFSYLSGCRLADVEILDLTYFCIIIFISWSLLFPLSIKLYYRKLQMYSDS